MNEMTVPTGGSLAAAGRGFEGQFDQSDFLIPRAKLLQALSPEVAEGLIEDAKAGQIINSLTNEILPSRFVPVFAFKSFFRFNPRNKQDSGFLPDYEPGAMIWRSNDPNDPRVIEECAFGPNGEKPLALTCLNFFSHFPGVAMPVVVSFSKTSYKTGKQLFSLSRFCGGDIWTRAYQLDKELVTNDLGTYYIFKITTLGESSAEERALAESWWKSFSKRAQDLKVHEESDEQNDVEV